MPFDTNIETAAGILGIWELLETHGELEELFRFSENERSEYQRIKYNRRKTEFLSTRLLTEVLIGKKVEIEYLPTRKPRIKNESMFVSISHSENFVAVLISKNHRVGIDIERTDRNIGIASKRYLCGEETEDIRQLENQQIGKIIYWCAKESIFKCTLQDRIVFSRQIKIAPFPLNSDGSFSGILNANNGTEHFNLSYFHYKNNIVVYCVPM